MTKKATKGKVATKKLAKGAAPTVIVTVKYGNAAKGHSFNLTVDESKSFWTAKPTADSEVLAGFGTLYIKPVKTAKS